MIKQAFLFLCANTNQTQLLQLSNIYIYPVKSLAGIELQSALVTERGLEYDRSFMLIDTNNKFITQRDFPSLALLKTSITSHGIAIFKAGNPDSLLLPYPLPGKKITASIWNDQCEVIVADDSINSKLQQLSDINCRLVYLPQESIRPVNPHYVSKPTPVSLTDGFPFLIVGKKSIDLLNNRLQKKITPLQFRPNFIFRGGSPFEEDSFDEFQIGNAHFKAVKPCSRCIMTTINPTTAEQDSEPLNEMSKFRKLNNEVYFAQNLVTFTPGQTVQVGDELIVHSRKPYLIH